MKSSLIRIHTIARNTLTEALRQKVLNLLLLFGVIAIGSANFFADFSFGEQFKFLKDFCFGAIGLFGTLMALMGAAQLLPNEMESRTIYTILSKPVRRAEFLLGKYLGLLSLLFIAVSLMSLVFTGVLLVKEKTLGAAERAGAGEASSEIIEARLAEIHQEAHDPRLVQGMALVFAKLAITAALALLVSTFATSTIFTVATTALIYIIGHLQSIARSSWLESGATANLFQQVLLGLVSFLIPDLGAYSVIDDIVAGNAVPWSHSTNLLCYTVVYITVVLLVAQLIFQEKEL